MFGDKFKCFVAAILGLIAAILTGLILTPVVYIVFNIFLTCIFLQNRQKANG
jgi:hypothetical protein